MTQQEDKIQDVLDQLATLAPAAGDAPRPAPQALARFWQVVNRGQEQSFSWRLRQMFKRKYALALTLFVLVFAVAFSFPAVRAAASDFLGLFRVQKFAAVSVSPQQLALLEQIAESGLYPGEYEIVDEPGPSQEVSSLEEAAAFIGQPVRSPAELGQPDQIYVQDGGSGRLIINVENARAMLAAAGADPDLIPDSLDGQVVDVTIYPAVSQNWEDVVLLQSASPLVEYPENVDVAALGEAVLQALGMDRRQARRLARDIDWTNTLLLPIPEDVASFSEVTVDGESGLALSDIDGGNAAVIWQKEGTVYILSGFDVARLVEIANSLH